MRNLLLTFVFLVATPAWAGLYLEPYAGYLEGTTTGSITVSGVSTNIGANENGAIYGGKAGLSITTFAFGFDYMGGSINSGASTFTSTNYGAFAQISIPMLMKFSASYYFSSEYKSDQIDAKGNSFKVGVGFNILPMISINLDYFGSTYSNVSGNVSGVTVTDGSVNSSGGIASISIPIDL